MKVTWGSAFPRSVKERQLSAVDTCFTVQFSLRNSKQPMSNISQVHFKRAETVNKGYSGSGVRICYTPVFIDKIHVEWEKLFIPYLTFHYFPWYMTYTI